MRERKGGRRGWIMKGDGEANRKRCDGDERKAEGGYALLLYALWATFVCTGLNADGDGMDRLCGGVVGESATTAILTWMAGGQFADNEA
jgi:hypothetical protein